ncbi:MAG: flavodoxin-dependent (E)-4-hydroxy-3-methylbut-2-enyl-diphosphate synthase [Candidatus Omnitrophica bacterium]|nr:flavodoxin-dependent (E)-4-hydroxy-3-methylbut-2-enyl-diphosphate synthase [Candidatus Omnitrophota bacterium]
MTTAVPFPAGNITRPRRKTRQAAVRDLLIGGQSPIPVQTMVKVPTRDYDAVMREIEASARILPEDLPDREQNILKELQCWDDACELAPFYCDINRVSVPDEESAAALERIVKNSPVPIVSDIHFRPPMALAALEAGTDKLRINPGNIRDPKLLQSIAREAVARRIPIRVGVNAGSLDKDLLEEYGHHSAKALAVSAANATRLIEDEGVSDLVVSLKANDARWVIDAYRIFAENTDYPLHLGVTEAGCGRAAVVNSWTGMGALLQMGIGDTIRVSLTEDSRLEVVVGHLLLHYLGLPRCVHSR